MYNEKSIKILEGLEAVRKRPGMYIGSTDRKGLHQLVWEIVDNSVDEVANGYGDKVIITLDKDSSITIEDNGRGIPIGLHESGKSTPEVIFTVLHAGGKFEENSYKISGGLHGVGASVVNALSSSLELTIKRDNKIVYMDFEKGGKVKTPLKEIGKTRETGTKVKFIPDKTIFNGESFSYSVICERMEEIAFLMKQITIIVRDSTTQKENIYHFKDGIKEFVKVLNADKETFTDVIYFSGNKDNIEVEIALEYNKTYHENIISFVNNVKTIDGGSHEVGFKTALTKILNEYAKNHNYFKGKETFEGSDVREGLVAILSIHIPESILEFEGQTKSKLGTLRARTAVETVMNDNLPFFLEENNAIATMIVDKTLKSKAAREAARKARDDSRKVKNTKGVKSLSGKLQPASSKNKKINELFLVEGDSAGGSAKQGRDRKFQAILPLRGKVLNTEKTNTESVLQNEEIATMIYTIGAGYGSNFNVEDSEYDKIIIMTDADDDGAHIQCLLLTFFYRYMKPLVEKGKLYIAVPPLYKVTQGKNIYYAYTDEDKEKIMKQIGNKNYNLQRYKGLGEMNADQLWETTMNPKTRNLIRVNITDPYLAEKRVTVLMGDDVLPRKEWIEDNVEFTLKDDFKIGNAR